MACWLYVLYSEKADRYYVGQSTDPHRRLEFHNSIENGFTARYRPWRIVFLRECESTEIAGKLESKVKRWKSRKMIEKLIKKEITL